MSEKHKLTWVPLADADRTDISYEVLEDSGKLVYSLSADLTFGHLECNGHPITGYFKPEDDTESVIRPWMVGGDVPPPSQPPSDDEEIE